MAEQVVAESFRHRVEAPGAIPGGASAGARRLLEARRESLQVTDYQDALHVTAEGRVSRQELEALIDVNIGTEYDAVGNKVRAGAEAARYTRGTQAAEDQAAIIEGNITPAVMARVTPMVEDILRQNPVIFAQYAAAGPGFIEGLLRDPATVKEIISLQGNRAALQTLLENRIEPIRQELARLREEQTRLTVGIGGVPAERTTAQTAVDNTRAALAEYRTLPNDPANPAAGVHDGRYVIELSALQRDKVAADGRITLLTTQLQNVEQRITLIQTSQTTLTGKVISVGTTGIGPADYPGLSAQVRGELNNLIIERGNLSGQLELAQRTSGETQARIDAISNQKTALEAQLGTTETKLREVTDRIKAIAKEITDKETEFNEARIRRQVDEDKFINGLTSILPEAVSKTINAKLDNLITHQIEINLANIAEARTDFERDVRNRIFAEFIGGNNAPQWANFDGHWETYIQQGPDQVLINVLGRADYDRLRRQTNPEIYNTLLTDMRTQMFNMRSARPGVLPFTRRRWNRNELFAFMQRYSDEDLRAAVNNKGVQKALDAALGAGVLRADARIRERLNKLPWSKILIAMAILGAGQVGMAHWAGINAAIPGNQLGPDNWPGMASAAVSAVGGGTTPP